MQGGFEDVDRKRRMVHDTTQPDTTHLVLGPVFWTHTAGTYLGGRTGTVPGGSVLSVFNVNRYKLSRGGTHTQRNSYIHVPRTATRRAHSQQWWRCEHKPKTCVAYGEVYPRSDVCPVPQQSLLLLLLLQCRTSTSPSWP